MCLGESIPGEFLSDWNDGTTVYDCTLTADYGGHRLLEVGGKQET
jgi:hypothetical protein